MLRRYGLCLAAFLLFFASIQIGAAAAKTHVITFGKATTVPWFPNPGAPEKPQSLKVRPLLVDGRVKEFTLGSIHDVTDRLFVVQRAFRVNDSLPDEPPSTPRWQWQRGGWLLVDRITGRVTALSLPDFDAIYSTASWYRDYAAYCGVSDDGRKIYAVVAQISRRKPVLKKAIDRPGFTEKVAPEKSTPENALPENASSDSACPAPAWQRTPARVTFEAAGVARQTFAIRGHIVDLMNDSEEDEEGGSN